MQSRLYECYGYRISCTAPEEADAVVTRLFGDPVPAAADPPATAVRLSVSVTGSDAAPVAPPYFPSGWDVLDEVVIEVGSSRATVTPGNWTVRVELARSDLANPIVWGRWLTEKALLILTLRSDRHYGLHAGALTVGGRSALVTADSGVGKSTFTAWGLFQGAEFAGEDAIMRHLDQPGGLFWGYPRCAYLSAELVGTRPELAGIPAAPVPARDKYRVEWPDAFAHRLRPAVRPSTLLVLTREHTLTRPLGTDAAIDRCRDDFAAGKSDPEVLSRVERDLRRQLAGMAILEFGLSPDLDANYRRLVSVLHDRPPQENRQ